MNVTPEIEVPIIPKATKYHGDFLCAVKKVALSDFLPVHHETNINIEKYTATHENTKIGVIKSGFNYRYKP